MPTPLTVPALAELPGVAHGFFTRRGGVSQGIFASLNCGQGSSDDPIAVRANRARVADFLGAHDVLTVHQVHSATAVVASAPWEQRPRADAVVTATRGLAVGALTADCAPVLLADAVAGVVGAAHAGWRGAVDGVVEAAIAAMETLGASRRRLRASVGPCIGQPAYQVGFDFQQLFLERDAESARFFMQPAAGARPHFDLAGYVSLRLTRAGIEPAPGGQACTYAGADEFFSFRRSQAEQEPDYGRQISAIVLT